MTEHELIKRIEGMNINLLLEMSFQSLAILTDNYKESLVKRVVGRGETTKEQEILLDEIRKSYDYNLNIQNVSFSKETHRLFSRLLFDLECGILITNEALSPTDEKKSESITTLEQRIKELEAENERQRAQLAQQEKN